jgi:hypothetical protein
MMTTIGKALAFVNLLIGMAMLAWSVTVYTQRPAYLDAKAESISPGQRPVIIAQLKEDIDNLGRQAAAASAAWGTGRKALEDLEAKRAERRKAYEDRLEWAKNGNPAKDRAGFFEPAYDPDTGLLNLTAPGEPILGPDKLPLKGVAQLGGQYKADVDAVVKYAKSLDASRDELKTIGTDILGVETRLRKMVTIRDSVQAELFHLATVEVNVYETRETVHRRKRQLTGRLDDLKGP